MLRVVGSVLFLGGSGRRSIVAATFARSLRKPLYWKHDAADYIHQFARTCRSSNAGEMQFSACLFISKCKWANIFLERFPSI